MKKLRKKTILSLFFILTVLNTALAQQDSVLIPIPKAPIKQKIQTNSFNLANIMDTLFANELKNIRQDDEKSLIRKEFHSITSKFNQGNAKVAYDEYVDLIEKIDNDTSLLILSRVFYEIGYFSLANKSIEKILYKNQFYDNILDLENSYKPKATISAEEEIYFAKLYSNIYFTNSSDEAIADLLKKKNTYQKHDFYHYTLSRAYLENKQYSQSIQEINKAISLNQTNLSYQIFKIDALIKAKKYKDALKQIEKLEKSKLFLAFRPKLNLQKELVQSYLISNSKEKKYHIANKTFLEGNFEKTKNDCLSILNFDKDNDKIISLYAKSELALGNIERANVYFVNSYKIEKNNLDTIIGLGDIRYLHGDYKNAIKMYKKAYKADKSNYEVIIKLLTAQRQHAKYPKEIKKLEIKLDKMPKNDFLAYYNSAISIAQKNSVVKEEFLKRAIDINPLYEHALGELIELNLKNKNFKHAKNLIYNSAFTLEKNYYYYYLCALYSQAVGKRQEAIKFYKTSLSLNPNFEIANKRLLKLIPDVSSEEI
ncbi:MAG: hypothetical protein IJW73_05420 [Candidatus Gastranaerophilales bacterium]|nr:hypothetical protein [Candidatus Gastranaerophilales bacterium]